MCGIVCYKGKLDAREIILEGLSKLEYRGYDSSGIALMNDGEITVVKEVGGVDKLKDGLKGVDLCGNLGIGHIRWATHGKVSKENAHPHLSENGKISVVHNGIIDNYKELKNDLIKEGFTFRSETDTEVIANLLEKYYQNDLLEAISQVKKLLKGSYALGIISADEPDRLVAIRKDSPLVLGIMDDGYILASDSNAFSAYTNKVIFIEDNETVDINKDQYKIYDKDLKIVDRKPRILEDKNNTQTKMDFDHFMLKEIYEQKDVIENLLAYNIDKNSTSLKLDNFSKDEIESFNKIYIVACGTAYNSGLAGKYAFEKLLRCEVRVELASEFIYSDPIIDEKTLLIVLSQSGETADTLKALRLAKEKNALTLAITNTEGSSIDREADRTIYSRAGLEVAVASTKAYTSMIVNLYLLALEFGEKTGSLDEKTRKEIIENLFTLPEKIGKIYGQREKIKAMAKKIKDKKDLFYLARGLDYATAIEASLKLKEISYIHSEAFAAGELKHGTLALIEEKVPVIGLISQKDLIEKTLSNIEEVLARKAEVYIISSIDDKRIEALSEDYFIFPKTMDILSPIIEVIPCQLLAYYTSLEKGLNVDKPRNLAKSVTVE